MTYDFLNQFVDTDNISLRVQRLKGSNLLVNDIEYVKKRREKEKNKYVFLCTNFVKGNTLLVLCLSLNV
jgi:hypothetical protein